MLNFNSLILTELDVLNMISTLMLVLAEMKYPSSSYITVDLSLYPL